MATQSTMQPMQAKASNYQDLSQAEPGFDSTSAPATMATGSNAPPSVVDLPLADPFASEIIPLGHEGLTGVHGDDHYGKAPCDGPTVWYCSNCGDGPIGTWNPACVNCGHAYCGACVVQET